MKTGLLTNGFCLALIMLVSATCLRAQATAESLLAAVRAKLEKVNDYEASGKMKTNVIFIKAPIASVKVYFKKPNRLRIHNEAGISFVPKGAININLGNLFADASGFDIIDMGKESGSALRVIKLLPRDDESDIVLTTLFVDEKNSVIRKAKTTTRESGTYELEMTYGKYIEYGLADKVIFSFNTKEFKLPKGITFDYDDGSDDEDSGKSIKDRKGKVEITYSEYKINKGVPDSVFN
jgi:hypothetical protein